MIRVAMLTTDSREHFRDYDKSTPSFGSAPEALLEGFAALPEMEVHVISCLQRPLPSPERLRPNIYYHGLHVPKLGWMRTGYQGCVRAVRRRLRQIQPDLVHGQGTERDCGLAAALSGRPNVLTIHGHMRRIAQVVRAKPFTFYWIMSRLETWALRKTLGVICISRYTQQAVQPLTRRTWLISNAVGNQFFQSGATPVAPIQPSSGAKESLNALPSISPLSSPLILCVGHINRWKNQNWLIHALEALAQQKQFRLRFVGRVIPNYDYCDEFQRLLSQRKWCEHIGQTEREVVRRQLDQAAMLVLPSLEENCPMVILEAMAAGVPVVAADVGGVGDLVLDKVTGLLVPSQDTGAFREAVATLLADRTLANQLRIQARREANRRFRPEVVARQHLEVYRGLIDQ